MYTAVRVEGACQMIREKVCLSAVDMAQRSNRAKKFFTKALRTYLRPCKITRMITQIPPTQKIQSIFYSLFIATMNNQYKFDAACVYFIIHDLILSDSNCTVKNIELYQGLADGEKKHQQLSEVAKVKSVFFGFT